METKTITPKYKKQQLVATENYNKSYYELNKNKWKEYNSKQTSQYLDCEVCHCSVQYSHRNIHYNTKKHKNKLLLVSDQTTTVEDKTI